MGYKRWISAGVLGAAMLLGFNQQAGAQTSCTPTLWGVPALSGPPVWWDNNKNGTYPEFPLENDNLDDARWQGSSSITYGSGATEEMVFRAGQSSAIGGPALYLSWNAKTAPAAVVTNNVLYIGFSGIAQDVIIKLTLATLSPSPQKAKHTFSSQIFLKSGSNWVVQPSVPAWLDGDTTRVWINTPANSWAYQLRVPISAAGLANGLNLGSSFKMWYEVLAGTPTSAAIPYTWPRQPAGPKVTTDLTTFEDVYPSNPSLWGAFQMGGGCTAGVSLEVADVGTTNTPSSKISFTNPNTFFAKPLNQTGGSIAATGITARFRTANWGSQMDWNDLGPATASKLWADIPGGGSVSNVAAIPNGSKGDLEFTWTMNSCDTCHFYPSGSACYGGGCAFDYQKKRHQCMLVELSGPGISFLNSSVYRNMDFEHASTFERVASINIAGLKPITGAGAGPVRDVYLYVEKRNMPAVVDTSKQSDTIPLPTPGKPPQGQPAGIPQNGGVSMASRGHDTGKVVVHPNPVFDSLADLRPTYIVHVYHATGDSMVIDHKKVALLEPQSAFGYFIDHAGKLYGWTDTLMGAEKIAPNFYRLSIHNDSAADITTRIEALEEKPNQPPVPGNPLERCLKCLESGDWHCWLWVFVILVILILLYWLFLRKKP